MTDKEINIFKRAFYLGLNAVLTLKQDIEYNVQVGPKLEKVINDSIYKSEQKAQNVLYELNKYYNTDSDICLYNLEKNIPNITTEFVEEK